MSALVRVTRAAARAWRLQRRPLRVSPEELARALGGLEPRAALRGPVLRAMPTVGRFERALESLDAGDRADLLRRADALLAHSFDLLGSGPTDLGPRIDWHADFKTGRRWPLTHYLWVPIVYPDSSDIKVPWELSRCQHVPLLAAAHRVTGDRRHLDEIGRQLEHWIVHNPVEFGPNWACTMDVAIRAANWTAALTMVADAARDEPWFEPVIGSLLLHGRFIRAHLEWAPVRGNHYLADVVGLLAIAALFSAGPEGRAWGEWAAGELISEMEHQVHPDGCDHEASIAYHRLVCELFICGTQAADAIAPQPLPGWYRERLGRMLQFVADYTRPDGLAPQLGDADDGRYLPLADYGRRDPRSHVHLFEQADKGVRSPRGHVAYHDGGYFVMRNGDAYAILRCGDTGLRGHGGHSHNDQLSFELTLGGQPMVIDPGAYLYTADPVARNLFRSTAFHSTLQIGGAEQNELQPDQLFSLPDRSRAELITWEHEDGRAVFEGRQHGFAALDPPATHTRRVEFNGEAGTMVIRDWVQSAGSHALQWTFPLAACRVLKHAGGVVAEFEGGRLQIAADGVEFAVEEGWYSPSYGRRVRTPFVRARKRGAPPTDVTEFRLHGRVA